MIQGEKKVNVLVQSEGIILDRGKRIPGSVLTLSTLPAYGNVIIASKKGMRKTKIFLHNTEKQTKPWYADSPLNKECLVVDFTVESILKKLHQEDVLITRSREEASLADKLGITAFWINPDMRGRIPDTKIYIVPELREVPSLIQRLKGARTHLEKQYGINPLDYI